MNMYISKKAKVKVYYKKYFFKKIIILEDGVKYKTKRNRHDTIQIDHVLYNENTGICEILTTSYINGIRSVFHNFLTVPEFLAIIGILPGSYTTEISEDDILNINSIIFEGLDDISMYVENRDMVSYKIRNADEITIKEGIGFIQGIRKENNGTMSCAISDVRYKFYENGKLANYEDIENCYIDITPIKRLVH